MRLFRPRQTSINRLAPFSSDEKGTPRLARLGWAPGPPSASRPTAPDSLVPRGRQRQCAAWIHVHALIHVFVHKPGPCTHCAAACAGLCTVVSHYAQQRYTSQTHETVSSLTGRQSSQGVPQTARLRIRTSRDFRKRDSTVDHHRPTGTYKILTQAGG